MAYRYDKDLEFLKEMNNGDLEDFVNLLIYDPKDNEKRVTETLSTSDEYKMYGKNYKMYMDRILEEFQLYGGNTLVNIFRGFSGVCYDEIVRDVASALKVKDISKSHSPKTIEDKILQNFVLQYVSALNNEQLKEFARDIGVQEGTKDLTPKVVAMGAIKLFNMGGFKSYQITMVIVNQIWKILFGKGLTLTANATINKTLGALTGPIGWAITGVWTAIDIASPATRVTIPAVLQIALLRRKYLSKNS